MLLQVNKHQLYLRLTLYILPAMALAAAGGMRFSLLSGRGFDLFRYACTAIIVTAIWAVACRAHRLYDLEVMVTENSGLGRTFGACAMTYTLFIALLYLAHEEDVSRVFLLTSLILLFLSTMAVRIHVRRRSNRSTHKRRIRMLIVGAGKQAEHATSLMCSSSFVGCDIVGYVRLPGEKVEVTNGQVFELNDLRQFEINSGIDDIVFAVEPARIGEIAQLKDKLSAISAPIRLVLDLGPDLFIRDRMFRFGCAQMLDLGTTPADSLHYSVAKRMFDVIVSALVLILASPVLIAIAIAVKLTSPGPVLYKQDRVGLNGKTFRMYKFRSMNVAPPQEGDTKWTTTDDPRRTKLGVFLRRTSLDELPQFLNVLKGEMSIVGPRPERPHFVRQFLHEIGDYNARHRLKVGITGWAQVNGLRGDTSIPMRVKYDLYYLQNWSFLFDLRIIARTVVGVFWAQNAY